MSQSRTCHECKVKMGRGNGFDTYGVGTGPIWICWWCYRDGLRTETPGLPVKAPTP